MKFLVIKIKYDVIIFDVGGVLIDISDQHALAYLSSKGIAPPTQLLNREQPFCIDYESGSLSTADFITSLYHHAHSENPVLTRTLIEATWKAIIVGFYPAQYALLRQLRTDYKLIALSNTNALHWDTINQLSQAQYNINFDDFFDASYLSFNTGHLKPGRTAFDDILQTENIVAEQCLFVDDRHENIVAGKSVGMHTFQPTALMTEETLRRYLRSVSS